MIPWNKGALLYMVCDHVSCVHLRAKSRLRRLRSETPRCGSVCGATVRAVLRHFVPYKVLRPLRRFAAIRIITKACMYVTIANVDTGNI
jgi:hypothetical protein